MLHWMKTFRQLSITSQLKTIEVGNSMFRISTFLLILLLITAVTDPRMLFARAYQHSFDATPEAARRPSGDDPSLYQAEQHLEPSVW